ncbi:MAG: hypothetical protein JNL38_40915 [Myxococcales bacterium]|jgi:serine/threonine-protein kinase|nr:hypothetical protein [Myxococcales bacterium]
MTSAFARRLLALTAALAALGPATARAQASANDAAVAEVLFDEGKKLMAEGRLAEACPKLAESNRLDTGIGTLLFLGDCYEKNGQVASAWATFREAASLAQKNADAREKLARDRSAALDPVLPRLTIAVPPSNRIPGLVVTRDGIDVGAVQWDVALPMDPGRHVLRATAPGRAPWQATVDVARATPATVEVPLLPRAASPTAPPPREAPREGGTQRAIGLGLVGVGAIGVGVGAYFGLAAKSRSDDAASHCAGSACDATGLELRDSARSRADVATVAFLAGGLTLVIGAAVWLLAPSGKAAPQSAMLRF